MDTEPWGLDRGYFLEIKCMVCKNVYCTSIVAFTPYICGTCRLDFVQELLDRKSVKLQSVLELHDLY